MSDLPVPPPPLDETPPPEPQPPEPPRPFWSYEDLLMFLALFLPSLLLASFLVALLPKTGPQALKILLSQFVAYFFWFAGLWALLRLRYDRPFWASLAWTIPNKGAAFVTFGGPVLAVSIALLGVALRTPNVQTPMRDLLSDPKSLMLVGLFAITLGPICEELAFRGFMLPLLMRSFGAAAGIVLTAIPFGLLHGTQYGWLWQQVVLVTLAGVVFGWARWFTGSTAASTMMHSTYNLTFFVGYLVQTRNTPW